VYGEINMGEELKEGTKFDSGKLRLDLIPIGPLVNLVLTYMIGSVRYEDYNWRKGMKWSRIYAAMLRHLFAWWVGEEFDQDTGQPHLGSVAWGAFTLLEYQRSHKEFDDRPKNSDLSPRQAQLLTESMSPLLQKTLQGKGTSIPKKVLGKKQKKIKISKKKMA
jgi:hypothetical protein